MISHVVRVAYFFSLRSIQGPLIRLLIENMQSSHCVVSDNLWSWPKFIYEISQMLIAQYLKDMKLSQLPLAANDKLDSGADTDLLCPKNVFQSCTNDNLSFFVICVFFFTALQQHLLLISNKSHIWASHHSTHH